MPQTRRTPDPDTLVLAPGVALARGRAHEATGPARRLFALLAGAALDGPILWLRPAWAQARLHPDGVRAHLEPGRLVFAAARSDEDMLWAAEEALRAAQTPLVVIETVAPPALTPVRRLHLAAREGAATRGTAALPLLLCPDPGGAAGVETRWRLASAQGWAIDGARRWRLARLRDRTAPACVWEMRLTASGRLDLTPAAEATPTRAAP